MSRHEELKLLVKDFPTMPGIYLMKSKPGKIIYVGKAKSLKNRVRSYFSESKDVSPKTRLLMTHVESIEYLLTKTEVEAFLVEASLIKKHRPKYNIRLKDDKSYPYIRVSMSDEFPRLYLARKVKKDGAIYFGPFMSGLTVRETIRFLNRTFQIRDCTDTFMKSRKRACMTHQIGRCTAPCVKLINAEDYNKDVQAVVRFLRGKSKSLVKELEKKMRQHAEDEQFEQAARLRDSVESVKKILEKQSVIKEGLEKDQDAISYFGDDRGACVETLHVRQGRVLGSRAHFIPQFQVGVVGEDERDHLVSFLNQYYEDNVIPDEVLLATELGSDLTKLLEAVLKERSGRTVVVRFPTEEFGAKLVQMSDQNARVHFKDYVSKSDAKEKGLREIQEKFGLKVLPNRIECFDISNFQGAESVASQVVFEDGVPSKDHYRRYKIKTVEGPNDFASMKEVLTRRLKHVEYEDPQLIVVDGGKGQLKMAVEVLQELGRTEIPVVGIAKARTKGEFQDQTVESTEERFFLPGRQNPVIFKSNSEALHILVGIRDEAHRFAITYHRKLRENTSLESELDYIVGLGEKRKTQLLKRFESIDDMRVSTVEDIAAIPGFNLVLAERILLQLNEEESQAEKD
jgi:excinuclease ABC subunit C